MPIETRSASIHSVLTANLISHPLSGVLCGRAHYEGNGFLQPVHIELLGLYRLRACTRLFDHATPEALVAEERNYDSRQAL